MNGIRDENFYTVLGWMLNVLELKGNELIVFAIIYSFSQDGESEFTGSVNYLKSFANIESRQTIYATLEKLVEKQYICRRTYTHGRAQRNAYSANFEMIEQKKKGISALIPDNGQPFQ